MRWEFIVALLIAIPIILFPVAFLWYMNVGGIYSAIRKARVRKAIHREKAEVVTPKTISRYGIPEVQVFRKTDENGIAEAISHEASPAKEEARGQKEANTRQTNQ